MSLYSIIKKPVVSEKSQLLELSGVYTVIVDNKATKVDVRSTFERLYGVKVESVSIIKTRPKFKNGGKAGIVMKRGIEKKALVKLASGSRLADFQKILSEGKK
jgi:large subunit ribosomal protein L23